MEKWQHHWSLWSLKGRYLVKISVWITNIFEGVTQQCWGWNLQQHIIHMNPQGKKIRALFHAPVERGSVINNRNNRHPYCQLSCFYDASITWIPNRKESNKNYKITTSLMNINAKIFNEIFASLVQECIKAIIHHNHMGLQRFRNGSSYANWYTASAEGRVKIMWSSQKNKQEAFSKRKQKTKKWDFTPARMTVKNKC